MKLQLCSGVAALIIAAAAPAVAQETLNVFWVKGFYKSEDDALFEAVRKFEQKTGTKVALSQYAVQDMIPKTVAALDWQMVATTIVLAITAAVIAGFYPTWRACQVAPATQLKTQ